MRFTSIIFHCAILISSVAEDEICIDPTLGYHWSVAGWGINGGKASVGSDAPSFTTAGYDCSSCNPKACGICDAKYPTSLTYNKESGEAVCELCDVHGKERFIWPIETTRDGLVQQEFVAYCETSVPQYAGGWLFLMIFSAVVLCPCCCFMGDRLCNHYGIQWYKEEVFAACCILLFLTLFIVSLSLIGVGCPYGEYNGEAGCTICPAGTYSDERGLSECKTCPLGKHQPNEHTTGCIDCIAGMECNYNVTDKNQVCADPALGYYWSVEGWGINGGVASLELEAPSFTTAGYDCSSCHPEACGICDAKYPTSLTYKSSGEAVCELCDIYGKERFIWPIETTRNGTVHQEFVAYCETSVPQYAGGWLFLIIISSFCFFPCLLACFISGLEFKVWYPNEKREKGFLFFAASFCTIGIIYLFVVSLLTIGVGCPYGEYNGEDGCTKCAAGTYSDERGLSECKTCPYGKYQPNEHTTGCLDCVAGVECNTNFATPSPSTSSDNEPDDTTGSESGQSGTDIDTNKTVVPGMTQCTKTNGFDLNSATCQCGTNICDEETGLVCDIQFATCSFPSCTNGENCCTIFFEPKESYGCDVANDRYCIAASKAVFVVGETQEELVRDDVVIACGAECLELKYSEIQMNILSGINFADMFVEIGILIIMLGACATGGERDPGNLRASKVGLFFIAFDAGLQIAALTMARNTMTALRPFVNANCLDLRQKDGVDHHNTLNSVIGGLESTSLLGAVELLALFGKFISDLKHWLTPEEIKEDKRRTNIRKWEVEDAPVYKASLYMSISLGLILHIVQTIMAIIDYTVYTQPAQAKLNAIFASNFELDGSKWCVQPMNSTIQCLAEQNKLDILGYSSTSNTGGYGSLNAGVRRLGSSIFGSP